MPLRAVIFDAGGVFSLVADTGGERYWERKLGLAPGGIRQLITPEISRKADLGLIAESEAWEEALAPLGLDADTRAALAEDFWAGAYLDYDVAFLIERAHDAGYRTGLLSIAWLRARAAHTALGWDRLLKFDVRMFSAEEGLKKPDPAFFNLCLERLGVCAEEALFVDDTLRNVEAARRLGMQGVHYADKQRDLAELERLLGLAPGDI
jgi:epoxide hydrolase-like predicted phosphatase